MATPKYSYQENPSNELTGFKIEDGKYKDVIYTYGRVSPIEESEKLMGCGALKFLDKNHGEFKSIRIHDNFKKKVERF